MPEVKILHVVSVSSEDKNFPAENLVKCEGFKKWKSGSVGERQVSVTLQLEKATHICQVDIGNEGSAFIEVLVGRSSMKDEQYQVMLVASSFMNPLESRNGQNMNRVRIFTDQNLASCALNENWDKVKVVCTQPFNKGVELKVGRGRGEVAHPAAYETVKGQLIDNLVENLQSRFPQVDLLDAMQNTLYGISFIKLHSPADSTKEDNMTTTTNKPSLQLGAFCMKSADEDNIKAGSLFANRTAMAAKVETPLTGAAAVRAASKLAEEVQRQTVSSHGDGSHLSAGVKRRHSLETDDKPSSQSVAKPTSGISRSSQESKPHMETKKASPSNSQLHKDNSVPVAKKTKVTPEVVRRPVKFGELMKKVMFVLSGFQNPLRSELREKALQMGAKYSADWNDRCTHLVCAFSGTPKYDQVKGKGRIVLKEWVVECYKSKQLLPWRSFRLGNASTPPQSSDEEEVEIEELKENNSTHSVNNVGAATIRSNPNEADADIDSGEDTEEEVNRLQEQLDIKPANNTAASSSDDTTDESATCQQNATPTAPQRDVYDASTDDELPELPDFFSRKHFFVFGELAAMERRTLLRYITAYDGSLDDYMNKDINFVITNCSWDANFDDAISDNPSLTFVRPAWIHACHESQKLVAHQKYIVVPA